MNKHKSSGGIIISNQVWTGQLLPNNNSLFPIETTMSKNIKKTSSTRLIGKIVVTDRELSGLPAQTTCKIVGRVKGVLSFLLQLQAITPCKFCGHKRLILADESDFTIV